MHGGVVVGTHGEGSPNRRIPERGGVRWDLVGTRRIGDGDVVVIDVGCLISGVTDSAEPWVGDRGEEEVIGVLDSTVD